MASELSPYPCSTVDFCRRFGFSPERRAILTGFLDFREKLQAGGLVTGFQWLDGSFLEDIEAREDRAPRDLDVVTVYWGFDADPQAAVIPEFASPSLAKANFHLDHYPFDAGYSPDVTVEWTRQNEGRGLGERRPEGDRKKVRGWVEEGRAFGGSGH